MGINIKFCSNANMCFSFAHAALLHSNKEPMSSINQGKGFNSLKGLFLLAKKHK
jgi:hypothetical protein